MGYQFPVESLQSEGQQPGKAGAPPTSTGINEGGPYRFSADSLSQAQDIEKVGFLKQAGRTFGASVAPPLIRTFGMVADTLLEGASAYGREQGLDIPEGAASDVIFKAMDDQIKTTKDFYATKKNEEENVPGRIVGALAGAGAMVAQPEVGAAAGFSPTIEMAQDMIQKGYSLTDIAKAGVPRAIIDQAANFLPFAAGAKLATAAGAGAKAATVAGAASGAVISPVTSAAARAAENVISPEEYRQDVMPTGEQALVESLTGAGFGAHGAAGARASVHETAHGKAAEEDRQRTKESGVTPADQLRAAMGQKPGEAGEAPPAAGINVAEAAAPDVEHVEGAPPPHFVEPEPGIENPPAPSARGIDVQEIPPESVKAAPAPKSEAPGLEPEKPEEIKAAPPPKTDKQLELEKLMDLAETPQAKAVIQSRMKLEQKRIDNENAAQEMRDLAHHTADPEEAAALLAKADKLHPIEMEPPAPATPPSPAVEAQGIPEEAPARGIEEAPEPVAGAPGGVERRSEARPTTGDNPLQPGEEPTISADKIPEGMAVSPYDPALATDPHRGKFWAELPPEVQKAKIEQFQAERARIQTQKAALAGLEKQPVVEPPKPHTVGTSPFFRGIMDDLGGIHSDERADMGVDEKVARGAAKGKGVVMIGGAGRGRLFHKGGVDMDRLTEWMQQKGYLSDHDVKLADATGTGGSHELARELIQQELREPGSVHPMADEGDRWNAIARLKQRNEMMDEADRHGIETRGRTDEEIQHDLWLREDQAHAAEHGHEPEHMQHLPDVQRAAHLDPDAVERLSIQHENDLPAFHAGVKEILNAHDSAAAGAERPGNEPGPGGENAESAVRGQAEAGPAVPGGEHAVRDQPGAGGAGGGHGAETGREIQPAGADRGNETPAGQAGKPLTLERPTPEGLRARAAAAGKTEAEATARANAPRPEDFKLAGSDRDVDQLEARGQKPLFARGWDKVEGGGETQAQVTARRIEVNRQLMADPRTRAELEKRKDEHVDAIKDWLDRKGLDWTHADTDYSIDPDLAGHASATLGKDNRYKIAMAPDLLGMHPNTVAKILLHEHAHIMDWNGSMYSNTSDWLMGHDTSGGVRPIGPIARELVALAGKDSRIGELLQYPLGDQYSHLHGNAQTMQSELFAQAMVAHNTAELKEVMQREAPQTAKFLDDAMAHAATEGEAPRYDTADQRLPAVRDGFLARRSDRAFPESGSGEAAAGLADREHGQGGASRALDESRAAEVPEPPPHLDEEEKAAAHPLLERVRSMPLLKGARENLGDITRAVQMKTAPMVVGSERAMAVAKDWANADRLARHQWGKFHDILRENYSPEDRKRMFDAGEEENQMRLAGETDHKRGLGRLSDQERDTMQVLHDYGENLLNRAKEVGMVDEQSGVPYWVPHMAAMIGEDGSVAQVPRTPGGKTGINAGRLEGTNLRSSSENLLQRKYQTIEEAEAAGKAHFGEGFKMVHDVLTMPLAMGRLERAIAGRELINNIKRMGEVTGQNLVDIHPNDQTHFTINHPAFTTYKWEKGEMGMKEAHDKGLWDGLAKVGDALGISHERLANLKQAGWWGSANRAGQVKTKFAGPESVLTHELGHQIDFKYGLVKEMQGTPGVAKELRALADARYASKDPSTVSGHYKRYVREGTEKMANLVHAYVHAPELLSELAPKAKAKFDAFLDKHPEIGDPLRAAKPGVELGVRQQAIPFRFPQRVPLHVSKEFEGPLRAILNDGPNGKLYEGAMGLKTMAVESIMYSPAIHLSVVLGRTFPAAPGRVMTGRVFVDGNRVLKDPANTEMREFIQGGLVPISKFGNRQDITGIATHVPDDPREQTWPQAPITKAVAGAIKPFSEKASLATAKGLYKAGDFWHNKLLWDQVAKIQAGLAVHSRDQFLKQGFDRSTAVAMASHLANRYAGAVPNESMSTLARKFLNLEEFSRSFTTGNLGAVKDVITGMPRDVQAQIERDMGPEERNRAVSVMRRKSAAIFAADLALMYLGGSTLQDYFKHKLNPNAPEGIPGAIAGIATGDTARAQEAMSGYERRAAAVYARIKDNPLRILNPFDTMSRLTPMSENEPGKKDRILVGYGDDGTARYYRFSFGKVGEDFAGWMTHFHDMLAKKESTLVRPLLQIAQNDKGFEGSPRPVWDKNAVEDLGLPAGVAKIGGQIAKHFVESQLPMDTLSAIPAMASGKAKLSWEDMDTIHAIAPLAGLQFSKGFPGGPAYGEIAGAKREHLDAMNAAAPEIRQALKEGDEEKASRLMDSARMTPGERKWFYRIAGGAGGSRTAQRQFHRTASPEALENFQRDQAGR